MTFRNRFVAVSIAASALPLAGCASDAPKHWKQLEQCLIGEPLAKDENVFTRLRGVQLAESLEATGGPQDWPQRCAEHATNLHQSLPEDGKGGMIRRALQEQLGCDGGGCVFPTTGHPLPAADKLWEAVSRAELGDVEAPSVPKPKAPVKSLSAAEFPALANTTLVDKRQSDRGDLWLLFKGEKGLSFCSVSGDKAKCSDVKGAPKFHANAPVALAPDTSQPIVVGSVFSEGTGLSRTGFSLAQNKPVDVFGEGGHEAFSGVGFAQQEVEADAEAVPNPDAPPPKPVFDVARVEDGKPSAKTKLEASARVRGPEVIDDWFVYVERNDDQKTVFKAKELAKGGKVFGATTTEYEGDFPGPFQVCRSKPGAAIGAYVPPIRQLGKPASGKSQISVTLLEGKTWHAPVSFELPKQVGQFSAFRCGAGWGGLSWLEQQDKQLTVTDLVCKSSGCKTQSVKWAQGDLKNALALGHIFDQVVLVYESTAGDVRTRTAKLDDLPKAKSTLAFESEEFGGITPGTPSLVEGDQAYVALDQGGFRLLMVNGDGEVRPVKL